jgi:hypothetical protein
VPDVEVVMEVVADMALLMVFECTEMTDGRVKQWGNTSRDVEPETEDRSVFSTIEVDGEQLL